MRPGRAHTKGRPRRARRAMSFLEVIAAVAIISLVAASVSAVISTVVRLQEGDIHRLACAEIAHRLILQYLDDAEVISRTPETIVYSDKLYRWNVELYQLPLIPHVEVERGRSTPVGLDQLRQIRVTVWLSEHSGGSPFPNDSTTVALTRLVDPWAFRYRNPDSFDKWISDDAGQRQIMELAMEDLIGSDVPPPPGADDSSDGRRSGGRGGDR
jgi:type II secretory pathway pseudopilin PulG